MDFRVVIILILEAWLAFILLRKTGCLDTGARLAAGALAIATVFVLRAFVLDYETLDYQNFLSKWVQFFRENGGFAALKYSIGNYNIPYLYFLAFFSYLDIPDLYLIKLLSIFFDVLLAYWSAQLAGKLSASPFRKLLCFMVILFLPTVYLNGALWGQCDSIYAALAIGGIWFALDDRPLMSMTMIALSFAMKLQAVFIMPVYLLLLIKRKIRWYHLPVFPVVYILVVLPAVLAGRPFVDTLTLYLSQTGSIGDGLNYNSPSVFGIFWRVQASERVSKLAISLAAAFMLTVLGFGIVNRERLKDRGLLIAAALLCVGIPFLLPHMHDRYFFCADIMTLILAFGMPKLSHCAALTQFASLLGYHAYLKMRYLLQMKYGSWALVIVTVSLWACYILEIKKSGPELIPDREAEADI